MNGFVAAAIAMLVGVVPCGIVAWRGRIMEAVVAYQLVSAIVVMVLVLLSQGFGRPGEFELAVVLAVLLPGSGLVLVRVLERWL
ncbi:MAG: monovalent cation/H+ antiporter complex subunit F [Acidimicrobiales bacterium]